MLTPAINPKHYFNAKGGELIDFIEDLPHNRACAMKYLFRAGVKDPETLKQDLEKAQWYVQREIDRVDNILEA